MSDDPRRTSRVLLYEQHYAGLGDALVWTVDRLRRLCSAVQLTEYEIGAMIRMRPADMTLCLRKNKFPAPVELHLTLLERAVLPSSLPPVLPPCH